MATVLVFKSCFVYFNFNNQILLLVVWFMLKKSIKTPIKLLDLNLFTSLAYDYSSQVYNLFSLYKANFLCSVVVLAY